jgi:hypothetical protein
MLLIEEVQSDWHQAGRDKGYGSKYEDRLRAYYETPDGEQVDIGFGKTEEELNRMVEASGWKTMPVQIKTEKKSVKVGEGVPDAPFKDTWYQLALKRAIQHAAENGYDRIGLTTGSQQASRFDLSKQVERIISTKDGDGFRIFARDTNGKNHDMGVFTKDGLSDVVGKDLAKKIASQGKDTEVFEGVDLKVGGEGMKKYYDEIYPKFLDKYGKKWGARVGETKIRTQSDKQVQEDLDLLEQLGEDRSEFSDSGMARVRYIDITPEMKAGVSKGQPLFMAAPIGAGLLGSESMTPER